MYIPRKFQAPSLESVYTFIQENGFATLVSPTAEWPMATHTPLVYTKDASGQEFLVGHISIANEQREAIRNGASCLAIFINHHSYISSTWYDHVNVPTWNYVAVHISGVFEELTQDELLASLHQLVLKYEGESKTSFSISDMPKDMLARELRGIIGFRIKVDKIEAAYKLSQNRNDKNYFSVIEALEKNGDPFSLLIANDMKRIRLRE